MIYRFKTPFVKQDGSLIKPGDVCFIDNIDADDEVAKEVKKRLEEGEDKPKRGRPKKEEHTNE